MLVGADCLVEFLAIISTGGWEHRAACLRIVYNGADVFTLCLPLNFDSQNYLILFNRFILLKSQTDLS